MKVLRIKLTKKKWIALSVTAAGLLVLKIWVWDNDNNRWIVSDLFDRPSIDTKLTLAPDLTASITQRLLPTLVTDASKLEPTRVAGILRPKSIDDLRAAIALARQTQRKLSLSGARHSMGGQVAAPDAIHLDMLAFDRITYNPDTTITVQSGATWQQIQRELGKHNRSVRVMQDSNIFSVGGSLSSNVHGKDPRLGSLIESVVSFKLLNERGEEITCSRTENAELFRATIGGMGLFGVITTVDLKTVPNTTDDRIYARDAGLSEWDCGQVLSSLSRL